MVEQALYAAAKGPGGESAKGAPAQGPGAGKRKR